ncbi:MAG: hypothetical protein JW814_06415 [Candidatus Krumholzibacteriota bacterium]|nr:hypothetical protein [Candidatus Krumholzibacteriota bacterium]
MPVNLIDLRDRKVVMTALVIAAGIIVVNWRIVQPMLSKKTALARQQEEEMLQLPADLAEMAGFAASRLAAGRHATPGGAGDGDLRFPAAYRDPFSRRDGEPGARPVGAKVNSSGLICTAISINDSLPVAVLNGISRRTGDRFDGYIVRHISLEGVQLTSNGKNIFVPVARKATSEKYLPVISGID